MCMHPLRPAGKAKAPACRGLWLSGGYSGFVRRTADDRGRVAGKPLLGKENLSIFMGTGVAVGAGLHIPQNG